MATRNTKVNLTALVNQYIEGIDKAAKKTRELGSEAEKLGAHKDAFRELGSASAAMGTTAAVAIGLATAKFAEFDQAMSNVQAATHESTENMGLLKYAALDAGARTVFSATEAANAIEELAKAGVATADILGGGLDGALDLAAAGGLDVAQAAGIAATALQQFKLEGSDMSHVSDLLAAGAGKAMGDVTDLSQALNQAGLVAGQTGLSIEETTAGLSAFASAGLLGSDAGTSFKSMLQRLTPQSAVAKAKMDELGISAYDAQGNFIGLEKFAGNLQTSLAGLTTEQRNSALATIFGSDAVRAASVLYSEGAEGIKEWTDKVDDQGYAAETAAARLDNLKGDVEALGGAFDTALIQTGSAGNDALRMLTQAATDLVDIYNDAPEPVKAAGLALTGVTAAAGLAGGAFFLAVPKIAAFNAALATLGPTAQKAGAAMGTVMKFLTGPWGMGLAAGAVGVGVLARALDSLKISGDELENALKTATSTTDLFEKLGKGREWTAFRDVTADLGDMEQMLDKVISQDANWWERFTTQTIGFRNALKDAGDALGDMALSDLPSAQEAFHMLASETDGSQEQIAKLFEQMPGYREALVKVAQQMDLTADDATLLGLATGEITPAVEDGAEALSQLEGKAYDADGAIGDLADAILNFGKAQFDMRDAERSVQASLDDFTDSIEDNGKTLDINTAKGRANNEALDDIAQSYLELVSQMAENGATQEELNAKMSEGREAFIKSAEAAGATREAAEELADQLGLFPDNVPIAFTATGISTIENQLAALTRTRYATILTQYKADPNYRPSTNPLGGASPNADGGMYSYADGGFGSGIYSGAMGPLYKFAEPETQWEAFISGKQGQEQRNIGIAYEALARLGALPQPQVVLQDAGRGESPSPQVTMNVYAQPGMSEHEIATIAARKINDQLRR